MNQVTFKTVRFGGPGATGVGPGGGCLTQLAGVVVLLIMIVAIAVGIVVIPIVAAVSYFLTAAWFKLFGSRRTEATIIDGVVVEQVPGTRCVKCGTDLRGVGERGACPSCGTLFGFNVEVRHNSEELPILPSPSVQPPEAPGR